MAASAEQNDKIRITRIETAPYGTNAYILQCLRTGDSLLVDAPGEEIRIREQLQGTNPRYLVITHNHFDHTGALRALKSDLNIPLAAHRADADLLPVSPDMLLEDNQIISLGLIELKVLHTPGHTPGSICLLTESYLISGDTLFPGGPGRTNTPADFQQIVSSIQTRLMILPGETKVFPGHGDPALISVEKKEFNSFLSRSHAPGLCGNVLWLRD